MISKELFVEVLEDAKKSDDYQNWLNKQLKENGADGYIFQPTCVDSVVKLLHFYFEDAENIYYIKVIYNFSNQEICINNAIKWQLRRLGEIKGTLSFVEGVEPLMRLDLANTQKKEHKLFIIYPNVTALLKVINECEMVFVYPDTDVYGAQVISYKKLEENLDLLEV